MPPLWDPKENEGKQMYKPVHRHSPGMISFTYTEPVKLPAEVLEKLKNTKTFQWAQSRAAAKREAAPAEESTQS